MSAVADLVPPKDWQANLAYRADLGESVLQSFHYRQEVLGRCREDFLFWLNSFGWLFEPRPEQDAAGQPISKIRPFTSWSHQDRAYQEIAQDFGYKDIGVIKSRGEGASWLILMMMVHKWRFGEMEAFGLVSRNLKAADNPNDPDSLLWKVEWSIKRLPSWMISPDEYIRNRAENSLLYKPGQSTIVAYAATGDLGVGGRKTAFLVDEFGRFRPPSDTEVVGGTRDVTNCRIFLSTPQGPSGAYYEIMKNPGSMRRIELWWWQNPSKNQGLYRVVADKLELLDKPYWKERLGLPDCDDETLAHYAAEVRHDDHGENKFHYDFMLKGEFVREGYHRSPWYDGQCRRPGSTPRSIAQELDGDFGGSASRFFAVSKIEELILKHCVNPIWEGDILYETDAVDWKPRLAEGRGGPLQIWGSLLRLSLQPIPDHEYVLGIDIAAGSNGDFASNSTIYVIDKTERKVCAAYVSSRVTPPELAEIAIAMARFWKGPHGEALMVPERNGMGGSQFISRVLQLGFRNIYEQKVEDRRTRLTTKKLGFWTAKNSKAILLGEFNRALCAEELIVPDKACLEETKFYMLMPDGSIEHVAALNSEDPAGAKENHGDRVIGAACAWKAVMESGGTIRAQANVTPTHMPDNSIGGRWRKFRERSVKSNYW